MSNKECINVQGIPKGGAYSQAVIKNGFVFVSGITATEVGDFEGQLASIFAKADSILGEAGTSRENVLKTTFFLKNPEDFEKLNEAFELNYGDSAPARTTIVCQFVNSSALVEAEFIAGL